MMILNCSLDFYKELGDSKPPEKEIRPLGTAKRTGGFGQVGSDGGSICRDRTLCVH